MDLCYCDSPWQRQVNGRDPFTLLCWIRAFIAVVAFCRNIDGWSNEEKTVDVGDITERVNAKFKDLLAGIILHDQKKKNNLKHLEMS